MHRSAPIRFTAVASLALSASLLAQSPPTPQANPPASPQPPSSALPATPATTAPDPPPIPLTPAQLPPKRAKVTFAEGVLSISADNASLNQILRQIATDTGMKITGGVSDERVFGEYGPAPPDQILSALLDGTGSNMILVHRDGDALAELILTPRQGGPTPPSPNSAVFNDNRSEPRQIPPVQIAQPASEPPGPVNQVNPPASTGAAATGTSPADSSQPESPNGVKTPQQIYEQLQRMRQQQQQQQQQQQTKPQ